MLGLRISEEGVKILFVELDVDRSGEVTFEEFKFWMDARDAYDVQADHEVVDWNLLLNVHKKQG